MFSEVARGVEAAQAIALPLFDSNWRPLREEPVLEVESREEQSDGPASLPRYPFRAENLVGPYEINGADNETDSDSEAEAEGVLINRFDGLLITEPRVDVLRFISMPESGSVASVE